MNQAAPPRSGPGGPRAPGGIAAAGLTGWLLPQDDARQLLRMRRFLTGALSLLVVLGLMLYCLQAGLMRAADFWDINALVALWFVLFYALLRSGVNQRFSDPSLTMTQVMAASAIMYYASYVAGPARATFLIAVLAVFLFGVFRLRRRQLLLLALFDVLAHMVVIFGTPAIDGAGALRSDLRVELLELLVMGASLTWFALMAGQVSQLRASVTEHNRELAAAMQALQGRQAELDDVQQLAKLGTWSRSVDAASGHLGAPVWADQMFHILGLDPATATAPPDGVRHYAHPYDWERYLHYAETSLRPDQDPEIELRLLRPAGGVCWVRVRRRTELAQDGSAVRQYGTMLDITDAKQGERRLLMQHAVTRVLAETTSLSDAMPALLRIMAETQEWVAAACWRMTADGLQLRCVDTWSLDEPLLTAFIARHQAVSIPYRDDGSGVFLLPAWRSGVPHWVFDVTQVAGNTRAPAAAAAGVRGGFAIPVVAGGRVLRMLEFYSHDAREADALLLDLARSLGNQIGQFIERRAAESALTQARENLDMAVKASGIGFWDGDLATGKVYFSPQFTRILGYAENQFPSDRAGFVALIHPEDRARFFEAGASGIKHGNAFVIELRLRHCSGSYRWYVGRAQAFYGAAGDGGAAAETPGGCKRRATRMAGSLADIEERKRLERAKDEFVATVSHELRTPLTSIRGALGLLDGGVAGVLPHDAVELVQVALSGAERLSRLVDDVLNLAKLESGGDDAVATPLALDPLIDAAVKANLPFCRQLGVGLGSRCSVPGALVRADADRLMQVLTNLISNAAKFSPAASEVSVTSARAGRWLRISVIDHGSGIPDSFRTRIFEKFAQVDGSDARAQQGSGLGLSICRALVLQMQGTIDFTGTPGGGTTFVVELPLHVAAVAGGGVVAAAPGGTATGTGAAAGAATASATVAGADDRVSP